MSALRIIFTTVFLFMGVQAAASSSSALDAYEKGRYSVAYKEFRQAALQGDSESWYNLAVMLYSGKGVQRDKAEAVYWFIKAAEAGDQSAQYNLGVLFATDKELPDEYPKMENGEIYFEVGVGPQTSNLEKAVKWYKMAAEQGHVSAQLNLGVMYNQGSGAPQDYKEAAKWYQKAAEQGNTKAQLNLGILYDLGRGLEKDAVKAAEYYQLAAKKGMRDAQYNLGIIYYNGNEAIKRDYIKSYAWLALAKEQGSELAAVFVSKVEKKLKKMEKLSARKLAVKYYRAHLKPFQK